MSLFNDWRALAVGAALLWGFWGLLAKVAAARLDWRTALLFVIGTHFIVITLVTCREASYRFTSAHLAAIGAGLMGALGAILMYRALERAEGSTVIAISAQYVLVLAVLSWVILGESLSARKVLGLMLGALAIVLLSWKDPVPARPGTPAPAGAGLSLERPVENSTPGPTPPAS